jgi:hypothetical protein
VDDWTHVADYAVFLNFNEYVGDPSGIICHGQPADSLRCKILHPPVFLAWFSRYSSVAIKLNVTLADKSIKCLSNIDL